MDQIAPMWREYFGDNMVLTEDVGLVYPVDDYSYFQREAPGIWWFLSVAPDEEEPGATRYGLHTTKMVVNERALLNGVKAMVSFIMDYKKK